MFKLEDFPAVYWDRLYKDCGFTDRQLKVIELRRLHGKTWDNKRHAAELKMSKSTYSRRVRSVYDKIIFYMSLA